MLTQQRTVLENLGYAIASQSENEVIGVRKKWFWDCFATNLTLVIFIQDVDILTASTIEEDAKRMVSQARSLDPSSLPIGFQKGRAIIAIYLADRVEPDAQLLCNSSQKPRFATFFFPAVLDRSSNNAHYLRKTPILGGIYFSKFRYPVQHLLEPANAPRQEPLSKYGIVLESIMGLSFLCAFCGCSISIISLVLLAQNWH